MTLTNDYSEDSLVEQPTIEELTRDLLRGRGKAGYKYPNGGSMKVYGIDFTSAPSHRKPITCADCTLENGFLHLNDLKNLETFDQFDEFLAKGQNG